MELERKRIDKEIGRFGGLIAGIRKKLENESFVSKAPPAVVEAERGKISEYESTIEKLRLNLRELA